MDDLHQVTLFAKQLFSEPDLQPDLRPDLQPDLRPDLQPDPNDQDIPVHLFSHSMGTLVARSYMKKYDAEISSLILCGPPTENKAVSLGIALAKLSSKLRGDRYKSNLIESLATGRFNKKFKHEGANAWVCGNEEARKKYLEDDLCGYMFTDNGYLNLLKLQKEAFSTKKAKQQSKGNSTVEFSAGINEGWQINNANLPIFMIAGENDPVIQSAKSFYSLANFLGRRGYKNISCKLYKGMRHEILNEKGKEEVYQDIAAFLKKEVC